ncbi:MAG: type II toxin-antitoxin system antitoxin SocA domain-containing protein [Planctomycetota bacterium]
MAYDPKAVANAFLDRADRDGVRMTPMKLLKLLYIAHGWHLATQNQPLINEPILAWQYGPVIRSVYNEFKSFGGSSITGRALAYESSSGWPSVAALNPSTATADVLERVWNAYGGYTGPQLMHLTHTPDTPWYDTWHVRGGKNRLNAVINNQDIHSHFVNKAQQRHTATRTG